MGAGTCYKALPCPHICFIRAFILKALSTNAGPFPGFPWPDGMMSFPSSLWPSLLTLNASVVNSVA